MSISISRRSRSRRSTGVTLDTLEVRSLLSAVVAHDSNGFGPNVIAPGANGAVYATDIGGGIDKVTQNADGTLNFENFGSQGVRFSYSAVAYSASDNTLWAAGNDHLVYHFDANGNPLGSPVNPGDKSAQYSTNQESVLSLTVDSHGVVWFLTSGFDSAHGESSSEIGRIDNTGGTLSVSPLALNTLPYNNNAEAIQPAADGTAWVTVHDFTQGTSSLVQASWNNSTVQLATYNIADAANFLSNPIVLSANDGIPGDYSVWFTSSVINTDGTYPDVPGQLDSFTVTGGNVPTHQVGTQTQVVTKSVTIPAGVHSSLIPFSIGADASGTLWISENDPTDINAFFNGDADAQPVTNAVDSYNTATGDFTREYTGDVEPSYTIAAGSALWISVISATDILPSGDSSALYTIDLASYTGNIGTVGVGIDATATQAYTGAVSMFTSSDAGDFAYTLDYGNGTIFSGTVANDGSGVYTIPGNITYASAGNYPLTLTITSATGDIVTIHGTAAVAPATTTVPLVAQGILPAISGQKDVALSANVVGQPTLVVAQFSGAPATYTATINWGDGTSTAGTIVSTGTNQYVVELAAGQTKTYNAIGTFTISVSITDGTQTAVATSTANIVAVPVVASQNLVLKPLLGPITLGTVATFTADPLSTASWFKATIKWGDGSTSTGLIVRTAAGAYQVIGLHIYSKKGTYAVSTTITDTVDNVIGLATASVKITSVL